jgi:hypothetical protein
MSMLTCARCGRSFEPDQRHVQIDAEFRRINDRNAAEVYIMHEECWIRETENWEEPA